MKATWIHSPAQILVTLLAAGGLALPAFAQLAPGNLAVLRVGDGVQTLANTGNSVFLDQFSTVGGLVNSLAIPSSGASALTLSGTATSEGALVRSQNRLQLTFMGYNTVSGIPGLGPLPNSAAATTNRVVGLVNAAGGYSVAASTATAFNGTSGTAGNPRSAVTDGANNFWGVGSGNASSARGLFYFGNNSAATFLTNGQSPRVVDIVGGNLLYSVSSTTAGSSGIFRTFGLPASLGQNPDLFLNTGDGSSPYDFAFNTGLTLAYVADDRTSGLGGIQRWDFNGSTWGLTYTLATGAGTGARGLAVDFNGAFPLLYATTTEASANRLISITDTGAGSLFAVLSTAGANTVFRGLEFTPVPEASTAALWGLGLSLFGFLRSRGRKH